MYAGQRDRKVRFGAFEEELNIDTNPTEGFMTHGIVDGERSPEVDVSGG
jgi:hypothetical protein